MSQPYDIPLFGEPDAAPVARTPTAKDKDDALNKVSWRPNKSGRRLCNDCFDNNVRTTVNATWVRTQNGLDLYLCYRHKALRLEQEQLR